MTYYADRKKCQVKGCKQRYFNKHHVRPKINGETYRTGATILVCKSHHKTIHDYFTNEELRKMSPPEQLYWMKELS